MKQAAIGFAVLSLIVCGFVAWHELRTTDPNVVNLGSLVVLTLTLVVLVLYAYDTHKIAAVTSERWAREGLLAITYDLKSPRGRIPTDSGDTTFVLHNASALVVRARVNFNLQVSGAPVTAGPFFDGSKEWVLFPHQLTQRSFDFFNLLQTAGKEVTAVRAEAATRQDVLTMVLDLHFRDEFGATRTLPSRRHFFDFDRWVWTVTEES